MEKEAKEKDKKEKLSYFKEKLRALFSLRSEDELVTSEEAYNVSTYGSNNSPEAIIHDQQQRINSLIREKMFPVNIGESKFSRYFCVVDFLPDTHQYIEEIFKPFNDRGFKIIPLSDKVSEIANDNVYLISWYKEIK